MPYRVPSPRLDSAWVAGAQLAEARHRWIAAMARSTSASEVCQFKTLTRIARAPTPARPHKEGLTAVQNSPNDGIGEVVMVLFVGSRPGIEEAHQPLIDIGRAHV